MLQIGLFLVAPILLTGFRGRAEQTPDIGWGPSNGKREKGTWR